MMKQILFLLLLFVSTSVSAGNFRHFGEWSKEEQAWFAGLSALHYIDYKQTMHGINIKDEYGNYVYEEANPLYGERPSSQAVVLSKLGALGIAYWSTGKYSFKNKEIKTAIIGVTLVQAGVILHNHQVGVNIKVAF
jgi:hypothetical protein